MLPPSLQKSKERLERAADGSSPRSSIERIFAFLHTKAVSENSHETTEFAKSREVDLLMEVIAETAAELEREKKRTELLRRRLSELEEAREIERQTEQKEEIERVETLLKSENEKRDLIYRERNLTKALAQARADIEMLTLWKAQDLHVREERSPSLLASLPEARARRPSDEISEAAEQRARRMQHERLRTVMNKYYYQ